MRLFIAIPLPAEVKAALAAQQAALRLRLAQEQRSVRWVAPEAMHLTLQFLGEVDSERVPFIIAAIQQASSNGDSTTAISLHLGPAGAFPNLRRPQTLWSGVGGDSAALGALQRRLGAALEPLGFPPEQRPFSAHLTLGRVRREASSAHQSAIGEAVRSLAPPDTTSWTAEPPTLFESTLTPKGPVYTRVSLSKTK